MPIIKPVAVIDTSKVEPQKILTCGPRAFLEKRSIAVVSQIWSGVDQDQEKLCGNEMSAASAHKSLRSAADCKLLENFGVWRYFYAEGVLNRQGNDGESVLWSGFNIMKELYNFVKEQWDCRSGWCLTYDAILHPGVICTRSIVWIQQNLVKKIQATFWTEIPAGFFAVTLQMKESWCWTGVLKVQRADFLLKRCWASNLVLPCLVVALLWFSVL